jgi:hypothetical protein
MSSCGGSSPAEWPEVLRVEVAVEVLPGWGFVESTGMSAATICYLCPSGDDDNWDCGVVMSLCSLPA